MSFLENVRMAIESIKANKLRSLLTMLGIIIGISSVITIVSLGRGGNTSVTGQFEKIGANNISVTVNVSKADVGDYITERDIDVIKENIEAVKYISPLIQSGGIARTDKKGKNAIINGVNQQYGNLLNVDVIEGRFINDRDYSEGKASVVIEDFAAESLFGRTDVVGETITVGSSLSPQRATIVGVYRPQLGQYIGRKDEDRYVSMYVPFTFLQKLFPGTNISFLYIGADKKENIEMMGSLVINLLENRHNNKHKEVYKGESLLKQMEPVNNILTILTTFVGAVAAISLVVGGIGVMNIMLVSVTERTKEIGIRKSLGATTKIILFQFLTESVIISMLGGIIGMIFGIIASEIIGVFINIVPEISVLVVVATILFSSVVGIFFGIYPARKAAKLDPIEALRYE
ncbi:MAG: ABC transporter permease [Clostridiaceae bacterium]